MNCVIRLSGIVFVSALAYVCNCAVTRSFNEIKPEIIGEFVTVTGKVVQFHPPPEPRAPYAFSLEDESGQEMRIVVWPNIYERVDNRELLQTTGTIVSLTAEVAEYKEKLELHLQDWEEINVGAKVTSGTATNFVTTSSASGER